MAKVIKPVSDPAITLGDIIEGIRLQMGIRTDSVLFLDAGDLPASERLKFIFNFSYMNIDTLDASNRLHLALNVEKLIFNRVVSDSDNLPYIPPELSGSIKDLIQPSNMEKLKTLQQLIQDLINKFEPIFDGVDCSLELPPLTVCYSAFWVPRNNGKTIAVQSYPEGGYFQRAYYEFIGLLNGVPLDKIQHCSACGRIFYNDRKGVRYCENKCAWKLNSKKYRDKNPIKYRESQQKIMQEKYDKDVEVNSGTGALRNLQKKREEKMRKNESRAKKGVK